MEEVKRVLVSKTTRKNMDEGLCMVDSIQRLGLDYHFEEEIEATLKRMHVRLGIHGIQHGSDYQELSQVAFQFRMLRQEGYYIHSG